MKQAWLRAFLFFLAIILSGCRSASILQTSGRGHGIESPPSTTSTLAVASRRSSTDAVIVDEMRSTRTSSVSRPDVTEQSDLIRLLIWRGSISMEVSSVSNAVSRVEEITVQVGGHVESKSDSGEERAHMRLRVPAESLKPSMALLESIGRVTSRSLTSQDVTEQYVDIDARLQTMVTLRDRLRALLDRAEDVKDILAIERELGRVQADIDAMQARLNTLKGSVELATVSVTIRRKRILGPLGYFFKGAWWTVQKLFVIQD